MLHLTQDTFQESVLQSEKPVFVDFWAPWCGPCRMMEPVLEEVADDMGDVIFAKVNVDEQGALAQTYNILSIPTFMTFKGGQVVDQFSGAIGKADLKARIEKHV